MSEQPSPDYMPHACVLITDPFNFIKDCRCRKTSILVAMHYLANSETGEAAPSINYLSGITGIDRSDVIKTLKELVMLRKLERIGKKEGSHQVTYKVPGIPLRYFRGVGETPTISVGESPTSVEGWVNHPPVGETPTISVGESPTPTNHEGGTIGGESSSSLLRPSKDLGRNLTEENTDKEKKLRKKKKVIDLAEHHPPFPLRGLLPEDESPTSTNVDTSPASAPPLAPSGACADKSAREREPDTGFESRQKNGVGAKQERKIIAVRIIDYLNEKTGKRFRCGDANLAPIIARLNEGFTEQDLQTIVDNKTADWLYDAERNQYLRPSTLFRPSHADGYLQQSMRPKPKAKPKRHDPTNGYIFQGA